MLKSAQTNAEFVTILGLVALESTGWLAANFCTFQYSCDRKLSAKNILFLARCQKNKEKMSHVCFMYKDSLPSNMELLSGLKSGAEWVSIIITEIMIPEQPYKKDILEGVYITSPY